MEILLILFFIIRNLGLIYLIGTIKETGLVLCLLILIFYLFNNVFITTYLKKWGVYNNIWTMNRGNLSLLGIRQNLNQRLNENLPPLAIDKFLFPNSFFIYFLVLLGHIIMTSFFIFILLYFEQLSETNYNSKFNSNGALFYVTNSNKEEQDFIEVITTLPITDSDFPIIYTDRLILRVPVYSDIDAYYTLRTQPEAMMDSGTGKPDVNFKATLNKLNRLINRDKDSVYFFIFLKNPDGSEGCFIGDGGVHNMKSDSSGWPEFGYKFKKEFWGKGYATEFGKAFMEFWINLPRKDVKIEVNFSSIDYQSSIQVQERLTAYTRYVNLSSQNVLEKLRFQIFEGLNNELINWRKIL